MKRADKCAVPARHAGRGQTPTITDPVELGERLVCRNLADVAQCGFDGIGIRDWLLEGAMQISEHGEVAGVVEYVALICAVAALVLLHRLSRAEARLGGVDGSGIELDDLPFMRWWKLCWCA